MRLLQPHTPYSGRTPVVLVPVTWAHKPGLQVSLDPWAALGGLSTGLSSPLRKSSRAEPGGWPPSKRGHAEEFQVLSPGLLGWTKPEEGPSPSSGEPGEATSRACGVEGMLVGCCTWPAGPAQRPGLPPRPPCYGPGCHAGPVVCPEGRQGAGLGQAEPLLPMSDQLSTVILLSHDPSPGPPGTFSPWR